MYYDGHDDGLPRCMSHSLPSQTYDFAPCGQNCAAFASRHSRARSHRRMRTVYKVTTPLPTCPFSFREIAIPCPSSPCDAPPHNSPRVGRPFGRPERDAGLDGAPYAAASAAHRPPGPRLKPRGAFAPAPHAAVAPAIPPCHSGTRPSRGVLRLAADRPTAPTAPVLRRPLPCLWRRRRLRR